MSRGGKDLAVVRRILDGEEAAFAELVEAYQARLVRLASSFVSSRAIAEEVVQDTWIGVLDGLATFEGRSSLKTWIFRILVNRARTRGQREARSIPFSALGKEGERGEPAVDPDRFTPKGMWSQPPERWDSDTPEELLMRRQAMGVIQATLQELPENQRLVVMLRDVEGLESEEVCGLLEVSEANQRVLLHRARARLRRALEVHLQGGE